jgi:hypothetical protein
VTQPSDPFATPQVGPTPFATPASTSPVCPKCGWHQPDGARSCAACGLIFARYAEAERRRQAQAEADAARQAERAHHDGTVDDGSLPASPAGFAAPDPGGPVEIRVGEVLSAAAGGATGALWPLVALQFVPVAVALVVGITAATTIPALVAVQAKTGVVPFVLLAGLLLLVILRVTGGIVAGTLIAVDDAMEGIESRGALAVIGDGWARGSRALGVEVLMGLAMLTPAIPLGLAIRSDAAGPVLLGLGLVAAVGASVLGLRLALALPLAVLGQRDVVESLGESWALTATALWPIALSLVAAVVLSLLVSGVLSMIAIVPVLGWVAAFVGQALLAGFSMAVVAGLFRRMVPRAPRFG